MRIVIVLTALCVTTMCSPAVAQGVACRNQQSGEVDAAATQTFADMAARTDPQLAQSMAGTWFSETPSPSTGQISRLSVTYGADGRLQYQNQVWKLHQSCKQYQ